VAYLNILSRLLQGDNVGNHSKTRSGEPITRAKLEPLTSRMQI